MWLWTVHPGDCLLLFGNRVRHHAVQTTTVCRWDSRGQMVWGSTVAHNARMKPAGVICESGLLVILKEMQELPIVTANLSLPLTTWRDTGIKVETAYFEGKPQNKFLNHSSSELYHKAVSMDSDPITLPNLKANMTELCSLGSLVWFVGRDPSNSDKTIFEFSCNTFQCITLLCIALRQGAIESLQSDCFKHIICWLNYSIYIQVHIEFVSEREIYNPTIEFRCVYGPQSHPCFSTCTDEDEMFPLGHKSAAFRHEMHCKWMELCLGLLWNKCKMHNNMCSTVLCNDLWVNRCYTPTVMFSLVLPGH